MPRKMTLKQRIHSGFILAMAFFLVLASNRLNQRNFSQVELTVNSVFEDRVVAQEYIYRLNNLFHEKEVLLASAEWSKKDWSVTKEVREILEDFATTELTKDESVHFNDLKENYAHLQAFEQNLIDGSSAKEKEAKKEITNALEEISNNLDKLSAVQLSEGRQLTMLSKKSLSMNQLLSKLEIAFLGIIGILLLLVIFHTDKKATNLNEKYT